MNRQCEIDKIVQFTTLKQLTKFFNKFGVK